MSIRTERGRGLAHPRITHHASRTPSRITIRRLQDMITLKFQKDKKLYPISPEDVLNVANGGAVEVDQQVFDMLDERRSQIAAKIQETKEPAYGFNRGFGHNVDVPVPENQLSALQENLIRSHACCVGEPAPVEVVRATMFLRAVSLARGHSGVRSDAVRMLTEMLNHQITPLVPMLGSVGASGDLGPMSHIALAMIGEGSVFVNDSDEPVRASDALQDAGLSFFRPEMKEGLSLTNGVQYSNALGILSYFKLRDLLRTAAITTAISAQVMLAADTPFRPGFHELRPHNGALKMADLIWKLMKDSPIRKAHVPYKIDGEIQDPYSIRCAGQILGTCYDLIESARTTLEIEANSVTDNPLLLADEKHPDQFTEIISGGHFHGMPVAVKLYNFMQAMGIISRLSNMRCARYVDEGRNKGLGADLKWPESDDDEAAISSGMMLSEYTSAALTNQIWGACMPTHLFSLSTDAGQEDHVSMSAGLAVRVWETIPRLAEVLAIELAMCSQAAAIRKIHDHIPSKITLSDEEVRETKSARESYDAALKKSLEKRLREKGEGFRVRLDVRLEHILKERHQTWLSRPCEKVVEEVMKIFPLVKKDRCMAGELKKLAHAVIQGKFAEAAGQDIF
ncbi:aromatic amino acid ammonia-lyase [Desulfococcaceae bacterium HSG8]|nr:aromatic amino acid ammonia-lyase [Desulfococcaceae bacterium HSG8]